MKDRFSWYFCLICGYLGPNRVPVIRKITAKLVTIFEKHSVSIKTNFQRFSLILLHIYCNLLVYFLGHKIVIDGGGDANGIVSEEILLLDKLPSTPECQEQRPRSRLERAPSVDLTEEDPSRSKVCPKKLVFFINWMKIRCICSWMIIYLFKKLLNCYIFKILNARALSVLLPGIIFDLNIGIYHVKVYTLKHSLVHSVANNKTTILFVDIISNL